MMRELCTALRTHSGNWAAATAANALALLNQTSALWQLTIAPNDQRLPTEAASILTVAPLRWTPQFALPIERRDKRCHHCHQLVPRHLTCLLVFAHLCHLLLGSPGLCYPHYHHRA